MIIIVASKSLNMAATRDALAELLPEHEVLLWPHDRAAEADVVVGWDCPSELYERMSRLKLVQSTAAGTDNVIKPGLPGDVPVCRIVDRSQAQGMYEYVSWAVTYFHRSFDVMLRNQRERRWVRPVQIPASMISVGVMGLGHIGAAVTEGLRNAGYVTRGWSRSPKVMEGVQTFSGGEQLDAFLGGCNVLVCLLPLNIETKGLLDRKVLQSLPSDSALVLCGRGEHLVESDLREALASGHLRGAVIDVFEHEPLEPDHWMWSHPRVVVTPHVASEADRKSVMAQIAVNVRRVAQGQPPLNAVGR